MENKKIGIIFAMKEELDALKEYLTVTNEYKIFELKFYEGTINNVKCILVESGVGKVNAARTTQILIDNKEILNKISASNEEKLALLNLYKFIINTYKTNSRINIFSDYESILAGTKQL